MGLEGSTVTAFPPGWYEVQGRANTVGYWDGERWTGEYAPTPGALTVPMPRETAGGLVALGYITAIVIPAIGFVLGIVVATRPSRVVSRHGAAIICLSIVAVVVYIAVVFHGGGNTIKVGG